MAAALSVSRPQAAQLPAGTLRRLRHLLEHHLVVSTAHAAAHDAAAHQLAGHVDPDSVIERELAIAGAARARETVIAANAALHRVEQGTYGSCEACGDPIPLERLEVIPYAQSCVPCQRRGWHSTGREDGPPKSGAIHGLRGRR